MAGDTDTTEDDEQVEAEADTAHSDAAQEPDETDESVESAEDPSAGEDGEPVDDENVDADDAEDGEAQPDEGEPKPVDPAEPPPPDGFTSWDEVRQEAAEARRLRTQWEQAAPLLRQALEQRQQKQEPEQPKKSEWAVHTEDPAVRRALDILRVDQEAFKKLPDDLREKALRANTFISDRWGEYTVNPERLAEEVVLPMFDRSVYATKLLDLEKRFAKYEEDDLRRRGREELQKYASVIKTPQDQQELAKLVTEHRMATPLAAELIALRRAKAEFEAQRNKLDERAKSQAALAQRTRAAQGTKRGQRPGKPSAELLGTTDPREIARVMKARGQLE